MQISLNKNSDVPLRQQLAEQIVFLITTGGLHAGEQLPSVRGLARQAGVHHNTVSEAYQELVRRKWLTRHRGSRLIVGRSTGASQKPPASLDELINETIERAKENGYSLQALRKRVGERLLVQPPDHILIVEQETGLREIISQEVRAKLGWPVESCSPEQFANEPGLAVGAQVFAPKHSIEEFKPLVCQNRPPVPFAYSEADEHVNLIRRLEKPSIIAVVSVSERLLRTARGLLAQAIGRRHTFREFLSPQADHIDLRGIDVVFCDSIKVSSVRCRHKIRYHLVAASSLEDLASAVDGIRRP